MVIDPIWVGVVGAGVGGVIGAGAGVLVTVLNNKAAGVRANQEFKRSFLAAKIERVRECATSCLCCLWQIQSPLLNKADIPEIVRKFNSAYFMGALDAPDIEYVKNLPDLKELVEGEDLNAIDVEKISDLMQEYIFALESELIGIDVGLKGILTERRKKQSEETETGRP